MSDTSYRLVETDHNLHIKNKRDITTEQAHQFIDMESDIPVHKDADRAFLLKRVGHKERVIQINFR